MTETTNTATRKGLSDETKAALALFEEAYDEALDDGLNDHAATYFASMLSGIKIDMGKGRPPKYELHVELDEEPATA
jgi:hypothetical protein